MIQRKQTLFLLQLVLFGAALLFIPVQKVSNGSTVTDIYLVPLKAAWLSSTTAHYAAIGLNFAGLVLSFITIYLYKKRELQRTMCFLLAGIWAAVTVLIAVSQFARMNDQMVITEKNYLVVILGVLGILGAIMAARFIKKDIELLKSADRIR